MNHIEDSHLSPQPVWAIFGDLMAGLVGVFVLLLVWALGFQLELAQDLKEERQKFLEEQQRREALERALENPLVRDRVTFQNGKIEISGSVLFSVNSNKLQKEGKSVLKNLVEPLKVYLADRDEILMVSGFTDDLPIQKGNRRYADNWELSAQRALTVTRELIEQGMPPALVFSAAFGEQQPVASNEEEEGRQQNRRVEIAAVPRGRTSVPQ